jgi:hypothetical protein
MTRIIVWAGVAALCGACDTGQDASARNVAPATSQREAAAANAPGGGSPRTISVGLARLAFEAGDAHEDGSLTEQEAGVALGGGERRLGIPTPSSNAAGR